MVENSPILGHCLPKAAGRVAEVRGEGPTEESSPIAAGVTRHHRLGVSSPLDDGNLRNPLFQQAEAAHRAFRRDARRRAQPARRERLIDFRDENGSMLEQMRLDFRAREERSNRCVTRGFHRCGDVWIRCRRRDGV